MAADVDPGAVAVFGSENRALVLAVLANAIRPLTSYRVARTFGGQKIKVGRELRRLESVGLVSRVSTAGGRQAWRLEDPDLRSFLSRRIRISFDNDWDEGRPGSGQEVDRLLAEIESSLPNPKTRRQFYRPKEWKPSREALALLREKVRTPEKDAILRKYGARTSPRESATL